MALQSEKEKIAHLLRRFGFGASEAEMEYYSQGGLKGAIDKLINWEKVERGDFIEAGELDERGGIPQPQLAVLHWYGRALTTQRPLEEKLTIFWHDHFATSAQKVTSGTAMYQHINTIRDNAGNSFIDLLMAVSKDPAMLFWLDNQENLKDRPNENFAREVMELFTLSEGNYSEKDVLEAARCFTGWTVGVRRGQRVVPVRNDIPRGNSIFYFDRANHDGGEKQLLGNKGDFDGEDIVGILCGHPMTAKYITKKMWEFFVYKNPEPAIVERLAGSFRNSGLNIRRLVRDIMESPEFYSEKAERKLIKNPIDFCMSTARQLGIGSIVTQGLSQAEDFRGKRRALGPAGQLAQATDTMGMRLMYPPDVAGWDWHEAWISTATMVERVKWADRVFPANGQGIAVINNMLGGPATPDVLVDKMISVLDVNLPDSKVKVLRESAVKTAGGTGPIRPQQLARVANGVARLIFGSPEFQYA
ncbi:MAG: DUF1800 domain-containing protein [Armatimonadetes bacterium]|nr:DUF1800 domain-containing protein [Armatimonadota bacterium]